MQSMEIYSELLSLSDDHIYKQTSFLAKDPPFSKAACEGKHSPVPEHLTPPHTYP